MKLTDLTGPGKPGIASTEWWGLAAVVWYAAEHRPPSGAPWWPWAGHVGVTLILATAAIFYAWFRYRNKRDRIEQTQTKGREET